MPNMEEFLQQSGTNSGDVSGWLKSRTPTAGLASCFQEIIAGKRTDRGYKRLVEMYFN